MLSEITQSKTKIVHDRVFAIMHRQTTLSSSSNSIAQLLEELKYIAETFIPPRYNRHRAAYQKERELLYNPST